MDSSLCIQLFRAKLNQQNLVDDGLLLYERYVKQIELNKSKDPNVCFEATKALAEAIFRHVLKHGRIKDEYTNVLTSSELSTVKLYKAVCHALSDLDSLDIEIMESGKQFFHNMSEIRNSVGLIAHGKDLRDFIDLRQSTIELTIANVINYLLTVIEAYEAILQPPEVKYDENIEYNEYLDEQYYLEGISYSLALFDQDLIAYKEQLDEYNEIRGDTGE